MRSILLSLASLSVLLTSAHAQDTEPAAPALRALPFEEPMPAPAPVQDATAPAPELVTPPIQAAPITPPKPVTPAIELKPTGDDAVRLQIFLDEANFGPGVIDGKPGKFTVLAVQSWNEVHGYPLDSWREVNMAAQKAVPNPFATAIIPKSASKWINTKLPYKKVDQVKLKKMAYRSYIEFMSERYHTDVPYLAELNPGKSKWGYKPGDSLKVPNVSAFEIENLTGAVFKEDEALSQRHAVVDTKLNQVRIYEANLRALVVAEPGREAPARVANQSLIAVFPITAGKSHLIRYGKWKMVNSVELPTWRYDQQLLDTGVRSDKSLNIPGGPNNPVGVLWCGLNKTGIGLHGTSSPETIGRSRSSGCIRLANWDIVRIPGLLRPGCSVEIR